MIKGHWKTVTVVVSQADMCDDNLIDNLMKQYQEFEFIQAVPFTRPGTTLSGSPAYRLFFTTFIRDE
jgi:hypothetical protein